MQIIKIFVCKQITLFKNEVNSKLFTDKSYMYIDLTMCKQISSGLFQNVIYKLFVYKSYI